MLGFKNKGGSAEQDNGSGEPEKAGIDGLKGGVLHDTEHPAIVPNRTEEMEPGAFGAFLNGNGNITEVMIHTGTAGAELRVVAPFDKGGISRFTIGVQEVQQFEQIVKEAGFIRENPNMAGTMLFRKKQVK